MELKDYKEPIIIINLIQTLIESSVKSAWWNEELQLKFENDQIDEDLYIELVTHKRNELIEKNLVLLDVALIHLRIEDEVKYFKLKEIILALDEKIKLIYSKVVSSYPSPPPQIINKHVAYLQIFQHVPKSSNIQPKEFSENIPTEVKEEDELPEFELTRIKDKMAIMIDLGIIDHLIIKYPYLKNNGLRLTKLLSQFLNIEVNSLKKIINAFVTDAKNSTDYPKITDKVKNVIDKLTIEK
jgi:hypothetical protein